MSNDFQEMLRLGNMEPPANAASPVSRGLGLSECRCIRCFVTCVWAQACYQQNPHLRVLDLHTRRISTQPWRRNWV